MTHHFFYKELDIFLASISNAGVEAAKYRPSSILSSISSNIRLKLRPCEWVKISILWKIVEHKSYKMRRKGCLFCFNKFFIHTKESRSFQSRDVESIVKISYVFGKRIYQRVAQKFLLFFSMFNVPRFGYLLKLRHTKSIAYSKYLANRFQFA